jgi:hypothetical protein
MAAAKGRGLGGELGQGARRSSPAQQARKCVLFTLVRRLHELALPVPHQRRNGTSGLARLCGNTCCQCHRFAQHRAIGAGAKRHAETDGLFGADPLRGQENARCLLPSHACREEHAAGRLGRDTELGEGHAHAG